MATNVLILGLGGTGSRAVNMLQSKIDRMGKNSDTRIVSIVFDTDVNEMSEVARSVVCIPLSSHSLIGQIKTRLGPQAWGDFFPADDKFDMNDPDKGAAQWRKQSYITMLDMLHDSRRQDLDRALEKLDLSGDTPSVLIYTVASLAGGTGSGSFIPMTLYVKKRLRQICTSVNVSARAMLACPDIYHKALEGNPTQLRSVYANAYAILRELNAINQVVFGKNRKNYDDGKAITASPGRTPVRFRLGNPDSPAGVLFDSLDPAYHKPEKAPFSTVCLLEKINGIDSIPAHDEAMASILYSLICTKVGDELNSYLSNEERRQAGEIDYNRMYSAFSTSEIVYPVEEMIEYFAWRKTREDAEGAWLTLHLATQAKIEEKKKQAAAARRHYTLTTGDYAELYLAQQEAEERARTSTISEIITACTVRYEKRGNDDVPVPLLDEYWETLKNKLRALVPDVQPVADKLSLDLVEVKNPGLFGGSRKADCAASVCSNAEIGFTKINEYYCLAAKAIRDNRELTADSVLPMATGKDPGANPEMSFVSNILMQNGLYIHPVAAMVQLCRLRKLINDELNGLTTAVWSEIDAYEIKKIPEALMKCTEDVDALDLGKKAKKSAYLQLEAARLSTLLNETSRKTYLEASTDYETDNLALRKDCDLILTRLSEEAGDMMLREVLKRMAERVDKLIESYRVFFSRFDEQKKQLDKKVLKAEEAKSKPVDSTSINVGASIERRRQHYDAMMMESAFDENASNDVAGLAVFNVAYAMSCAKMGTTNGKEEAVDASAVFNKMYEENRKQIGETPYCIDLKSKNIIRAIAEENSGDEREALAKTIGTCYELAKPALRIMDSRGTVQQGFLILDSSVEEYIEDNKSTFGIPNEITTKFAQALLSGISKGARIATTKTSSPNVAFLCRSVLSVEPSEIVKVNELSGEDGYYKRYLAALDYAEKDNNDSWNPHLGNDWHKRGYLPFINPVLEERADEKFVKAMLYAILERKISFYAEYNGGPARFHYNSAPIFRQLPGQNAVYADENHLLVLIDWLRPQDALIEQWADLFDAEVDRQMGEVPSVNTNADFAEAKLALTRTRYLQLLRRNMFAEMLENSTGATKTLLEKEMSLSLFEFAQKIQGEEQKGDAFDCNDAEKFLKVASDLLWTLCARATGETSHRFRELYRHELCYFVAEMYDDDNVAKRAEDVDDVVASLLTMANRAGFFMDIEENGAGWKHVPFDITAFKNSGDYATFIGRVRNSKGKVSGSHKKASDVPTREELNADAQSAPEAPAAPVAPEAPAAPEVPVDTTASDSTEN